MDTDVVLKRFEQPDETRIFELGKFEFVRLGGMALGRATYESGWRWSLYVGPELGLELCPVAHVGLVISGEATAAFADGRVIPLRAGELFFHSIRSPQQLGRRERAVCISALHGRGRIRHMTPADRLDVVLMPGAARTGIPDAIADAPLVELFRLGPERLRTTAHRGMPCSNPRRNSHVA